MAFGKKYKFNPVPNRLGMLLVSKAGYGKSTLLTQLPKNGKAGVVVDADGRFDEVVGEGTNFYPLSDKPEEMLEPKRIRDTLYANMPNDEVGMITVDSVTAIFEPIVLGIQRDVEEGAEKGARGYKAKADAMKFLVDGVCRWGTDHVWVYHYRERGDAYGKMQTVTTITDLELSRLLRNINIKCEIVIGDGGKRGLNILFARGGRSGFVIWDESGSWENIRQRIEEEVWGGLSKEEQEDLQDLQNPPLFSSLDEAIAWSVELGAFDEEAHAMNSYNKLKRELVEEYGDLLDAELMFAKWTEKAHSKLQ